MELTRQVDLLREQLALRDERIHQLAQVLMAAEIRVPFEWSLTGSERAVFGVLLSRPMATKEAIMAALYYSQGRDEAEIKIVDVFVCKIRKKLRPFGVGIKTVWGLGYELDASVREKLKAA